MNKHDLHLMMRLEKECENWVPGALSLPVDDSIAELSSSATDCNAHRTLQAAIKVCQDTRAVWMVIHQRALNNPMLLSEEIFRKVKASIEAGLEAVRKAAIPEEKKTGMLKNMQLRADLVELLEKGGLAAVNDRVKRELAAS